MRSLPMPSHTVRWVFVALLAAAALGSFACGDDLPPGARPIGEADGTSAPAPSAAPSSAAPGAPAPSADAPRVVALDPPDGAHGVDPSRTTLSVTFDRAMAPEGWAWVIEDAATAPEIGDAQFDASGRTNTVDVTLEPNRDYVVWINSQTYTYFKGLDGTPAVPYRWTFSTAGDGGQGARTSGGATGDEMAMVSSRASERPRVVALDPANGATGVDPGREMIRVTFDQAMEESWAWVTEPGTTPPPTAGEPAFTEDRKTNQLPVDLAPNTTYTIWINSDQHQLFRSVDHLPAEPVRWTFTTGPR